MPYKNREDALASQRRWYSRNREKVIRKVAERKKNSYGVRCVVCGAVIGVASKHYRAPRFCHDHRKELWEEKKLLAQGKPSPYPDRFPDTEERGKDGE